MSHSLHSLLKAIGLDVPIDLQDPEIKNISSDSRCVKKGDLFFGLPGQKDNGGAFCNEAFLAGAVAAVVGDSARDCIPHDKKNLVVVVPDPVSQWMGEIASVFWGKPSLEMALIGVTGTNGKTTTTHLIEHLSKSSGKATALLGTLINRWPKYSEQSIHTTSFGDTLNAQLSQIVASGASLCAMEVSSHALSQRRVAGLYFSGAIFTNLTQDHLDYHKSMEAYFEAKALLFQSYLIKDGQARAVVNIDDQWGFRLAKRLGRNCWKSSLDLKNIQSVRPELFITGIKMTAAGAEGFIHTPFGEGPFMTPLIGRFNLMNLLQSIGVLLQQGFKLDTLLHATATFSGVPGRMEQVKVPVKSDSLPMPIVLVDYAHTPDGLKNALKAVRPFVSGKLICVFGCGGDRDKSKRSYMGEIAAEISDIVIVTSDNPRTEDPMAIIEDILSGIPTTFEAIVELDRCKAIEMSILHAKSNDLIIIAGKGHEDYQILGDKKIYFNDKEAAIEALEKR
ncbi:UDP-N-acetylmuramoyl-L-alanyl-D-glutamate--2,6-diaminopimelate ligase [Prochlorococcus marinus]|uniref:UDP-N-acetylmuramoyl-L-alanyl-D-glutamate--2,6-diaminopimelate ligase n=1 Tax=Prochlorococcus marinus (strain MIT 9211) TaxID=93059 RepID=A9BE32_PROM4|nr:UDP-N-acetylmuramoyl-L-alanyl-D-glutamate--2,6-diaminopimelate ligase [Prochlorococcus marinus]ABX08342.1 UDP-N-acetylmuramyl-tripeptide synthetase [Prochlorococcus marinus str. MIT 9211]